MQWRTICSKGFEAACRRLVDDRMKLTDIRCAASGARAMLHQLAACLDDDWPEFIKYHIEVEQTALYGKRAAQKNASYTQVILT